MKIPRASPAYCRANGIARALVFPGNIATQAPDYFPPPTSPDILEVRIGAFTLEIMNWDEKKIRERLDAAIAEFLAENALQMKQIRESLALKREELIRPPISKIDSELVAKIKISL